MFIEGLNNIEKEEASKFNPKAFEGEFIKIVTSYNPKDKGKLGFTDSTSYCKLSEYIKTIDRIDISRSYEYKGIFIGSEYYNSYPVVRLKFIISTDYNAHYQQEIIPITREEFINGCKSLLTPDLQELINWDKV